MFELWKIFPKALSKKHHQFLSDNLWDFYFSVRTRRFPIVNAQNHLHHRLIIFFTHITTDINAKINFKKIFLLFCRWLCIVQWSIQTQRRALMDLWYWQICLLKADIGTRTQTVLLAPRKMSTSLRFLFFYYYLLVVSREFVAAAAWNESHF